jgi:hypothetical protein
MRSGFSEEDEHIEFVGFLVNCDISLSKVKLRHSFKVKTMSIEELYKLFVSLDHDHSTPHLEEFFDRLRSVVDNANLVVVTNVFHSWGNEEGYFSDYDPSGPDRDDAFLIEDYLRPAIRLMKLFKEGDLDLGPTVLYEVQDGLSYDSQYGGGDRFGGSRGTKYFLDDFEIPKLELFLNTTVFPFKRGYVQLALDFFEMSYTLRVPSLIFIVLMISLEVLFNSDEQGGITRRISTNLSRLLAENKHERERIFSDIRTLYEKRSRLVHQGLYDYRSYIHRSAPDFEKAAKDYPLGEKDPRFIQPDDFLRLRTYVRSSIVRILTLDQSKEDLLKHLTRLPGLGTPTRIDRTRSNPEH